MRAVLELLGGWYCIKCLSLGTEVPSFRRPWTHSCDRNCIYSVYRCTIDYIGQEGGSSHSYWIFVQELGPLETLGYGPRGVWPQVIILDFQAIFQTATDSLILPELYKLLFLEGQGGLVLDDHRHNYEAKFIRTAHPGGTGGTRPLEPQIGEAPEGRCPPKTFRHEANNLAFLDRNTSQMYIFVL